MRELYLGIRGYSRKQLAQIDFGSSEPADLTSKNQRHRLRARDLDHARGRFACGHHRNRDLTGPRGARDRKRGPGQRLIEIRAHAGAGEHVARSYGKPFGLRVREALRRHQQELPETHCFQRARRGADVSRMRGLAQHHADILERIGGDHMEYAIRSLPRITRVRHRGAADNASPLPTSRHPAGTAPIIPASEVLRCGVHSIPGLIGGVPLKYMPLVPPARQPHFNH